MVFILCIKPQYIALFKAIFDVISGFALSFSLLRNIFFYPENGRNNE